MKENNDIPVDTHACRTLEIQTAIHLLVRLHRRGPQDLLLDASGNLYGTGGVGPPGWAGIFELSPTLASVWRCSLVCKFVTVADSAFPSGIIFDSNGHSFAATNEGRAYNDGGLVFEVVPWTAVAETSSFRRSHSL